MMEEVKTEAVLNPKYKSNRDKYFKEIIQDLLSAKAELDAAVQNFNFADSDELIDLYAYKIKAAQTKYSLFKKSKGKRNFTFRILLMHKKPNLFGFSSKFSSIMRLNACEYIKSIQ